MSAAPNIYKEKLQLSGSMVNDIDFNYRSIINFNIAAMERPDEY